MNFKINPRKAIEASATLLRLVPGKTMGRKRLLALLYIADRISLERSARPIVGGTLVAMRYGPIHSAVYDFIKGGRADEADWSEHFGNDGFRVVMTSDPSVSSLSRYEISILNEVSEKYLSTDDWDVADKTHQFGEYKKTYIEGTSSVIPTEFLLDEVGRGSEKETVKKDAEEVEYFDRLFAPAK